FKKWKWSKNRKSKEWKALAGQIRAREAQGKQTQVYSKGQLLSPDKVSREISRHGLGSDGLLDGPNLPLPSGFSIRSPVALEEEEPWFHKDLPLMLFEKQLWPGSKNDSATDASSRISVLDPTETQPGEEHSRDIRSRQAHTPNIRPDFFMATLNFLTPNNALLQDVAQHHANIVMPTLRAILPECLLGTNHPAMPAGSLMNGSDSRIYNRDFSSDYMRVLVFLLSNNMIDLDEFPLKVIWNYLRTRANSEWIERICNKDSGPTGPELMRRLFQCSILVGDSGAVDALLKVDAVKREAKKAVFVIKGHWQPYTTLELSLKFGTPSVTEVLLRHGAYPPMFKTSLYLKDSNPEKDEPLPGVGGSANIMVRLIQLGVPFNIRNPDRSNGLHTWLGCLLSRFRSEGLLRCVEAASSEQLRLWSQLQKGPLIDPVPILLKRIDEDHIEPVMKAMLRAGVELGELALYAAINNLAGSGRLDAVQMLLAKYQLIPTVETLVQAIKSGNRHLIYHLIDMGADPLGFTKGELTSPYVEALHAQDRELVTYFEDCGAIPALSEKVHGDLFVTAWKAAIQAGNEETVSKMMDRMRECKDVIWPGQLILVSVEERREDLALNLLSIDEAAYIPKWGCGGSSGAPSSIVRAALRMGFPAVMEALLRMGAELVDPAQVLEAAVDWGNLSLCEHLLPGLSLGVEDQYMIMYTAVKQKRRDMVDLLLDYHGPSFPATGKSGLVAAVENRDHDMALYLLSRGADPNDSSALLAAVTEKLDTPMREDETSRLSPTFLPVNMTIVKLLVTHFIKKYPRGVKTYGVSALQSAIEAGRLDIIDYLINNKVGISQLGAIIPMPVPTESEDRMSIFTSAIQSRSSDNLDILRKLLQAGADSNCKIADPTSGPREDYHWRKTPLLEAIPMKNIPMLELLISYGACVNLPATCVIVRTPLQEAAEVGDIDVVQFLIDRGADINARPAIDYGGTAVQLAAMSGWAGIVDLLLRKGADVNAPGACVGGRTALEAAAEHGRLDTIQILLNAGAGAGEGGSDQVKRAIKFARKKGHIGVYELLGSRFGKDLVPEEELNSEELNPDELGPDETYSSSEESWED
ncbi:hypothetical protein V8F06_013513, partial [Rhypophila decipiens]